MSKRRLDKCPSPLRRVSPPADSCSSGYYAPLTRAETIMSRWGDNGLSRRKHNIWSESEDAAEARRPDLIKVSA